MPASLPPERGTSADTSTTRVDPSHLAETSPTAPGDRQPASAVAIAHEPGKTNQSDPASEPHDRSAYETLRSIAGLSAQAAATQTRQQANDLATLLAERQQLLDQREAELNARAAKIENDLRTARLKLQMQRQANLQDEPTTPRTATTLPGTGQNADDPAIDDPATNVPPDLSLPNASNATQRTASPPQPAPRPLQIHTPSLLPPQSPSTQPSGTQPPNAQPAGTQSPGTPSADPQAPKPRPAGAGPETREPSERQRVPLREALQMAVEPDSRATDLVEPTASGADTTDQEKTDPMPPTEPPPTEPPPTEPPVGPASSAPASGPSETGQATFKRDRTKRGDGSTVEPVRNRADRGTTGKAVADWAGDDRLSRREARLREREAHVQKMHHEVIRLHREALELRLTTEQLWQELVGQFDADDLTNRLTSLRRQLADHYKLTNDHLTEQANHLRKLREELHEQEQSLRHQRRELRLWADRQYDDIEARAAELLVREGRLEQMESELERQTLQWQLERASHRREIEQLTAKLRPA